MDSLLWSSVIPVKISFFAWRLIPNYLPLDTILQKYGVHLPSKCHCCYNAKETIVHFFLLGPVAVEVWSHFARRFGVVMDGCGCLSSIFLLWFYSNPLVAKDHIRVPFQWSFAGYCV